VVAKRGDYATKLAVDEDWEFDVVAGTEKEVEFTLTESLANALIGGRPATFTFDNGVKISTNATGTSKVWEQFASDSALWDDVTTVGRSRLDDILEMPEDDADDITAKNLAMNIWIAEFYRPVSGRPGRPAAVTGDIEMEGNYDDPFDNDTTDYDGRIHISKDFDSFTVDSFNTDINEAGEYTFTVGLLIPAGVTGDVNVSVEGKGVTDETIKILEVEAPVEVETTKMDIKVGLKEIETTGKIIIKETAEERIAQGKDIVLEVDDIDRGLRIKSFKATVVEGDLELADDAYDNWDEAEAIGVKRVSTEPSTIEITDIVMFTDRTVPEGKYDLLVGGNAISDLTFRSELDDNIDPVVVVKDFINITTKNTEDISASANKAKVAFVVGSTEYLVNDKVQEMDVAPYIKDGRTMVPVRYVAAALGVRADQVIWDGVNQTATVLADKTIQVKLGSKMMVIDGVSVPMAAAAELTSDRTFVPVAEIARALSVPVAWDADNSTASFN
ncbi:MAG TPA: copper amine oxidase N-terminal domain-containing protein, partial [Epulopiscium sp.]|nr:copper amine oxidase N-terminal domain-containing protein [Candidatus Epulonipiscium sp.]